MRPTRSMKVSSPSAIAASPLVTAAPSPFVAPRNNPPPVMPATVSSQRSDYRCALDLSANLRMINAFGDGGPLIPALLEAHVAVVDFLDQRIFGRVLIQCLHRNLLQLGEDVGWQRRRLDASGGEVG